MQQDTYTLGNDLSFDASGFTLDSCLQKCWDNSGCKAFMFRVSSGACWLKNAEFTPDQYVVGFASANMLCFQG